jgi:hypothetical protein
MTDTSKALELAARLKMNINSHDTRMVGQRLKDVTEAGAFIEALIADIARLRLVEKSILNATINHDGSHEAVNQNSRQLENLKSKAWLSFRRHTGEWSYD